MTNLTILAPAKLNLYLEVLGKRQSGDKCGYHELESHAVFLQLADELIFAPAENLQISGSEIDDNIILKTAQKLQSFFGITQGAKIHLTKNIPLAAGLGGGSADAAATIVGLQKLWGLKADAAVLFSLAAQIGADVPACLYSHLHTTNSVKFAGIGEKLSAASAPKNLHFVLVNPLKQLSTAAVFANVKKFLPAEISNDFKQRRNDLQAPAQKLLPEISEILAALAATANCRLARMTGSGATCFGVYENAAAARANAEKLKTAFPNYWVHCTELK